MYCYGKMAAQWIGLKKWIWSESFWLPPNTTWDVLSRNETVFYPDANDLWLPIPIAVGLFLIRLTWERFIALPIGRHFHLRERPSRPPKPNSALESAFRKHRKILPSHDALLSLSKQLDWHPREIERWWRRRKAQSKPSEMSRFKETTWRFLFYLLSFYSGLYILWDKPWFWDTKHCWYNYPLQHVQSDVYWYYMLELSFYWSLVLSLFMDARRKDFVEMIVHHIATITLMGMSWSANMVRVGTLVLCVHDAVDWILEGAKLTKYCKFGRLCDVLFVVFTAVWFITRLVIYPFRILRSTLFEATTITGMAPIYYAYNGLLCILQVLHVIWFYMIVRMAYFYVITGKVEKDGRSDTDPDSNSDEDKTVSSQQTNGAFELRTNISNRKDAMKNNGVNYPSKQ